MRTESYIVEFLNGVIVWATAQPGISGVALVGSHARGEARPDSDIDLVLLCTAPQAFLSDTSWVQDFGEVEARQTEDWGLVTSLRVHYQSGIEVEFGMTTPEWARLPVDPGTRSVVLHGMQILMDRTGSLGQLQEAVAAS
jgi:predicted nucleotidyltransferase